MEPTDLVDLNLNAILDFDLTDRLIGVEIINVKYQAEQAGFTVQEVRINSTGLKSLKYDVESDSLYIRLSEGQSIAQQKCKVLARLLSASLIGLQIGNDCQIGM